MGAERRPDGRTRAERAAPDPKGCGLRLRRAAEEMDMTEPTSWPILVAVVLTAAAAIWDLRTGLIPNPLVAAGAVVALVLIVASAAPMGGIAVAKALLMMVAGAVLVSLVPVILYRLDGIGGGDVKLLAVVGAALGPYMGLEAELYAFASLLVYAPIVLAREGKLLQTMRNAGALMVRPLQRRADQAPPTPTTEMASFRFGPAIFVGTLAVACLRLSA